jgi:hypothetical protein
MRCGRAAQACTPAHRPPNPQSGAVFRRVWRPACDRRHAAMRRPQGAPETATTRAIFAFSHSPREPRAAVSADSHTSANSRLQTVAWSATSSPSPVASQLTPFPPAAGRSHPQLRPRLGSFHAHPPPPRLNPPKLHPFHPSLLAPLTPQLHLLLSACTPQVALTRSYARASARFMAAVTMPRLWFDAEAREHFHQGMEEGLER